VHKLKSHSNAEANLTGPIGFYRIVPHSKTQPSFRQTVKLPARACIHMSQNCDWLDLTCLRILRYFLADRTAGR